MLLCDLRIVSLPGPYSFLRTCRTSPFPIFSSPSSSFESLSPITKIHDVLPLFLVSWKAQLSKSSATRWDRGAAVEGRQALWGRDKKVLASILFQFCKHLLRACCMKGSGWGKIGQRSQGVKTEENGLCP